MREAAAAASAVLRLDQTARTLETGSPRPVPQDGSPRVSQDSINEVDLGRLRAVVTPAMSDKIVVRARSERRFDSAEDLQQRVGGLGDGKKHLQVLLRDGRWDWVSQCMRWSRPSRTNCSSAVGRLDGLDLRASTDMLHISQKHLQILCQGGLW